MISQEFFFLTFVVISLVAGYVVDMFCKELRAEREHQKEDYIHKDELFQIETDCPSCKKSMVIDVDLRALEQVRIGEVEDEEEY